MQAIMYRANPLLIMATINVIAWSQTFNIDGFEVSLAPLIVPLNVVYLIKTDNNIHHLFLNITNLLDDFRVVKVAKMTSTCKYCGSLLQNPYNSVTQTKKQDGGWWCFSNLCSNNGVITVEQNSDTNNGRYQRRKTIHFETDVINTGRRKSAKSYNSILKSMVCVFSI